MNVSLLIQQFKEAGITLWVEGDSLRYRAPASTMTSERLSLLKLHKSELLLALATPKWISDPANRFTPYPLTGIQSAYLLGRNKAFTLGDVDCHGYLEFRFNKLDQLRLERAWNLLIARHDMLRTIVYDNGTQQTLSTVPPVSIECTDIGSLSEEAQKQFLQQRRTVLSIYQGQPDCWPLITLFVTKLHDVDILHISFNLLVCDFQSARLLLTQLSDAYYGQLIPEPEIQFRDYVLNSLRLRNTPAYKLAQDYWLKRIDDFPTAPVLPSFSGVVSKHFYRENFVLSPEQFAQLNKWAALNEIGVNALFVTLYALTLQRWGAGNHFGLSLTMMQRLPLHNSVDQVIGDFSAVELLEINLVSQLNIVEQVKIVQDRLWCDLDHSLFTGIDLLRELVRRRGRETALYPVAFTSAISDGSDCCTHLMKGASQAYGITQTPQVALDCQIAPGESGLNINWDIREGTMEHHTCVEMFDAFRNTILTLCQDENAWFRPITIPLPETQIQRHKTFNTSECVLPEGLIHAPVWQQAERTPDALAVTDPHRQVNYRQLVDEAEHLAACMLAQGVKQGDRIVIAIEKCIEQIVAVLATMRAGAVWIPLDLSLPLKRQQWLLKLAQPAAILACRENFSVNNGTILLPPVIYVDDVNDIHLPASWPDVTSDSLAYIIFTSGSTGEPKGVMIAHAAARNTIEAVNQWIKPALTDRLLGLANLSFDLAVYDIFGILSSGAALILPASHHRSNPSQLAKMVADQKITLWNSVPAQFTILVDYLQNEGVLPCPYLRAVLLSGDWIPVDLPARARNYLPEAQMYSLGGATEVSIWSVIYPINDIKPEWSSIPYGRPLANQRLYVLDGELNEQPDGVAGELYIGGKGLAIGYFRDEEKTTQRFITHPQNGERLYRTGDLACSLIDGTLQFLGREDNQLKIRGHRVELAEVERTLIRHQDVATASAIVVDRGKSTQRLVAFVTAAPRRKLQPISQVATVLQQRATDLADTMNRPGVMKIAQGIEDVSLLAMAQALLTLPVFSSGETPISLAVMVSSGAVASRHERLISRWLRALCEQGFLRQTDETHFIPVRPVNAEEVEQRWQELHRLEAEVNWGASVLNYMHSCHRVLPALMRNDVDPLDLLFPEGQTHVAEAAYRDNLVSRIMNNLVCSVICQIAREKKGETLHLLEVGAGVGGTSLDLIPSLAEFSVDYLFSDLSHYFLNEAEKRFSDYPWVRYGLYDINKPCLEQGIEPGSRDVILCANVLHNSRHAEKVIASLKEILSPGGWLVFIEATSNSYQIMSSMEFKDGLSGFEDCRRTLESTFIDIQGWKNYLQQAGADEVVIAPHNELELECLGQHVFAARFKTKYARLHQQDLQKHLRQWLPGWMHPDAIHILDRFPLTANGKIDRQILTGLIPHQRTASPVITEPPANALEKDIAAIWQSVLKVDNIGRHDNFFALGGDSLLVAQVVSRLRASLPQAAGWDWDTLLRAMLNEKSLATLALRFNHQQDFDYALHEIQPGTDSAPALLLIHDGSGTLAPYRPMLEKIPTSMRVLGLALNTSESFLAQPPESAITMLAERAVELLAMRNETAPLHIIGYCLGGMLAWEIASRLRNAGQEVSQLSIISSYPVPFRIEDDLLVEYIFARVMQANPIQLGYPQDEIAFQQLIKRIREETPGMVPQGSLARFTTNGRDATSLAIQQLAKMDPESRLEAIRRHSHFVTSELNHPSRFKEQLRLIRHSLLAVHEHRLQTSSYPVTFVRQLGEMQVLPGMNSEMTSFWQRHCVEPLKLYDVPGDHFSCMDGANCMHILDALGLIPMRGMVRE